MAALTVPALHLRADPESEVQICMMQHTTQDSGSFSLADRDRNPAKANVSLA